MKRNRPSESAELRDKEKNRKNNLRSTREQIFYLLLFLLFVAVSLYVDRDSSGYYRSNSVPANEGWIMESADASEGTLDLIQLPKGPMTVRKDVSGLYIDGQALCFKSVDTNFDVYADGKLIYTYRPVIPKRLGKSYGMYVHTIVIPENTESIRLQLDPVFSGTSPSLERVMIEDPGLYISEHFSRNMVPFTRSAAYLLIGLLFLAIAIFSRILMKSAGLDFVSFGIMSLLIGLSGFNDTVLLQLMSHHPAFIRVITYACLMFMPFPALSFFAGATGRSRSKWVSATLILCLVNFGLQVILTHRGISDYYYLVYISHATIIFAFIVSIVFIVRAAKEKTISKQLLRCLIIGIVSCAAGVLADIVRFYFFSSYGSTSFTRTGVFIFMILTGVYLFRSQTQGLKKQHEENQTYIRELSEAFAKVIDVKDSYTNGHSSRVAQYTAMLATELGYDRETVEKYYRIALLHDVGKIGVPGEVLNKPGKLTTEEYETIKSHTSQGYQVLKDISIMPDLATGALAHHERPDGKGYPNGLKTGEIPRVAQIIAVADTFDAMYSNRPYRKRMNFEKAVSIIKEVSGTQLTPDVVDAFLRLVEKGEFRAADDLGGGSMENIENIRNE